MMSLFPTSNGRSVASPSPPPQPPPRSGNGALSSLPALYRSFVLSHTSRISQIESSLRTITFFLPSRFSSSDLSSELIYSFISLLSLYHDSLLNSLPTSLLTINGKWPSPHNRYTAWWERRNKKYKLVGRILAALGCVQLLAEMWSKRRGGEKARQRMVLGLETLKACLRLFLLALTLRRTVVDPPIPERDLDPSKLFIHPTSPSSSSLCYVSPSGVPRPRIASLRSQEEPRISNALNGSARLNSNPNHNRPTPNGITDNHEFERFLLARGDQNGKREVEEWLTGSKTLKIDDVREVEDLVAKLDGWELFAEAAWILRPLIYVFLLRRFGRKHPFPLALSFAVEYGSHSLRKFYAKKRGCSEVEKKEWERRDKEFWWYALRGPVWTNITKPRVKAISDALNGKPLVGLIGNFMELYYPLVEDYYYYTSS